MKEELTDGWSVIASREETGWGVVVGMGVALFLITDHQAMEWDITI